MTSDPVSTSMMWVGALMAFTPVLLTAVVLGIWWHQKKKAERRRQSSGEG